MVSSALKATRLSVSAELMRKWETYEIGSWARIGRETLPWRFSSWVIYVTT